LLQRASFLAIARNDKKKMICSVLDTQGAGKNLVILQEAPQIAILLCSKNHFFKEIFQALIPLLCKIQTH